MPADGAGAPVADPALVALLEKLKQRKYGFIATTPTTHLRVVSRPDRVKARDLRDMLGWNLPFEPGLDPAIEALLERAGALEQEAGLSRAGLRVASLEDWLLLHSSFPTTQGDAVFFGPDSYRFAALIRMETRGFVLREGAAIVDLGGGTGVGALVAAALYPIADVAMTEINLEAVRLATNNLAAAEAKVRIVAGAGLEGIGGEIDLAIANPPYIADEAGRAYRDGGGDTGAAVSLQMAEEVAGRLAPGGRFILYGGSAVAAGEDRLRWALAELAERHGLKLRYRELDPDVFGEELERPAYADIERIALIAAILDRPA